MATGIQTLCNVLPADRVLTGGASLAAYESDGLTAFKAKPRAVVVPETGEEVVSVVRWCHEQEVPFVARGSGTSLSGGSLPVEEGIVISLNRLNRILEVDPIDRVAVVEPGVVNLDVSRVAEVHGLHFAPDPSSQTICTIGGNVAFNSGGAHCLKYGMTANHVLGMKGVLATGEVVEFGGRSREQVGPDFTGSVLWIGRALWDRLGIHAAPAASSGELSHGLGRLSFPRGSRQCGRSGNRCGVAARSARDHGCARDRSAAAQAAVACGYPKGADAVLIVELEGPVEKVEAERAQLEGILEKTNAFETRVAANTAERMTIWKGRKSAFSAVGRLSPDFIVQDGVVPRTRLGEALRRIGEMSKETGFRVANVFHAGDGNLHPLILYDGTVEGGLEGAEALAGRILEMCVDMGGSITGEHGVGVEKRDYLPGMFSEDDIAIMKRVRWAFDPKEVANPGKMFPGAEAPALAQHGLHPLEEAGVISRE